MTLTSLPKSKAKQKRASFDLHTAIPLFHSSVESLNAELSALRTRDKRDSGKVQSDGLTEEQLEHRRAQEERIRAFRFARKTDPGVVLDKPLTQIPVHRPERSQEIVIRNKHVLSKDERDDHKEDLVLKWHVLREIAQKRHKDLVTASIAKYVTDLKIRFREDLVLNHPDTVVDRKRLWGIFMGSGVAALAMNKLASFLDQLKEERRRESELQVQRELEEQAKREKRAALEDQVLLEGASSTVVFVQSFIRGKVQLKRRRMAANHVWTYLNTWHKAGELLLTMKRFHGKVQRIQRTWLSSAKKFQQQAELICGRWITVEKHMITKELGGPSGEPVNLGRSRKPAISGKTLIEDATGSSFNNLALSDKIAVNIIPEKARMEFIRAELRYARFQWIPDLLQWRANMDRYWSEVFEWRTARQAQRTLHTSQGLPPPDRPPCPSFLPNETAVLDMIMRCRKDRKSYRVVSVEQALLPGMRRTRDPKTRDGEHKKVRKPLRVDDEGFTTLQFV